MTLFSPRLGIPIRELKDSPVDLHQDHVDRTAVLDQLCIIGQGNLSARPVSSAGTPGIPGRIYITLDQPDSPRWDVDLGTSWTTIGTAVRDGAANIASARTLGTGANQACAGNDIRLFAPGDIKLSAAPVLAGWLVCDGTAYSRSDPLYVALFNAIGTAHGAGDGSTTFNVPDLRSRTPVGAGQGAGLTSRTNGQRGGEETHALVNAEMPAHAHGFSGTTAGENQQHMHATNGTYLTTGGGGYGMSGGSTFSFGQANGTAPENQAHSHNFSGGTDNGPGGNVSHNNMQPFSVVNYFIKT